MPVVAKTTSNGRTIHLDTGTGRIVSKKSLKQRQYSARYRRKHRSRAKRSSREYAERQRREARAEKLRRGLTLCTCCGKVLRDEESQEHGKGDRCQSGNCRCSQKQARAPQEAVA